MSAPGLYETPGEGGESHENRLKRLSMRSMRRGIKEMDIILKNWADARLEDLDDAGLTLYDRLLSENDQDLYQWVTGQVAAPDLFADLIEEIATHAGAR